MKKHKITRAELNEKSWERKKLKKKKGLARRGNRANPQLLESQAPTTSDNSKVEKTENKAIPLFIKSRKEPLVAKDLPTITTKKKPTANQQAATSGLAVDLVVTNGKVVSTKELEQAHKKAKQQGRAKDKAPSKESNSLEGNKKLGRAALRRLEKEEQALGNEEFFAPEGKERKEHKGSTTATFTANNEDRRIKSRDYKAGRNTDYVATQAAAEKAIKPKVKKRKLSGEELLDAWENIKW